MYFPSFNYNGLKNVAREKESANKFSKKQAALSLRDQLHKSTKEGERKEKAVAGFLVFDLGVFGPADFGNDGYNLCHEPQNH